MAVLGICALCRATDVELHESHIIPSWAYKRARASTSSFPDPVRISNGRALQTSRQFKERMLCGPCEQALGVQDNYAATLTYSEGTTASFFTQIELEGVPANSKFIPARASTL